MIHLQERFHLAGLKLNTNQIVSPHSPLPQSLATSIPLSVSINLTALGA